MKELFTFDDILLQPKFCDVKSRKDTQLDTQLGTWHFDIPIASSNMDTVTGTRMAAKISEHGGLPVLHRFCTIKKNVEMFQELGSNSTIAVSVGVKKDERDRFDLLYDAGARIFFIDVANGWSSFALDMLKYMKDTTGGCVTVATGSIATAEAAIWAGTNGFDILRVGIGGGSACTTRIKTGVGVPQAYAIKDCATVSNLPIIADGGIRKPADAAKALSLGADMIMLGGMLAGTSHSPGKVIVNESGKKCKLFRGMASREVNEEQYGSLAGWKTAEGISTLVPYKGNTDDIIRDICGGIRSTMTYCGVKDLRALSAEAIFNRVSSASIREGFAHVNA